ncbi:15847_t:CDS:1 [Cetraspora pellucida]|uniref:15847_t:CDS:1 n=1 Tax=Cetraspora pellucida TaxID=1433469 RepID=A0A9N9I3J2_9GLOM|nr:15847_t:CDS:1 [Cetraspora pellucida]
MNLTHSLVSPIFLETHPEIDLLTENFSQLKIFYQTEKDYEIFSENTCNIENEEELQYFDNQVITLLQIKKFQIIFSQKPIKENNEEQEVNKKLTIILDQQEKDAFIRKLCMTVCYKTKTCLTKIDHESAFKNFDNI